MCIKLKMSAHLHEVVRGGICNLSKLYEDFCVTVFKKRQWKIFGQQPLALANKQANIPKIPTANAAIS